ncbi:MAG TPA: site-specific integrase [Aurantimonas sp.]|jgi:integrase|nr:site-specific integrase [Aurantimonas sp.]
MARTVRDAKLETRAARARLPTQDKPHYRTLVPGQLHLGYRKRRADAPGTWTLRRYVGRPGDVGSPYKSETLGLADDYQDADGATVLSYADAQKLAHECARQACKQPDPAPTVASAIEDYLRFLRTERKTASDAERRANVLILPALGSRPIDKLTTVELVRWRDGLAAAPARLRTRPGEEQRFQAPADHPDARRARRATANRTVTILKAALNRAFRHGRVADDTAWRRLEPFSRVDAARQEFLSVEEAQRLLHTSDAASGFRSLVHGALLTGCRYGELCALRVADFAFGRIVIRESKSGRPRDVRLTDEGRDFFRQLTLGRPAEERMFLRGDGEAWGPSHQSRPMLRACQAARIPPVGFHQLRHTWASLAVMNETPLMVVAGNLGHADTRMVERHYGHLTEDYIDEAIRRGAPRFGAVAPNNVAPLKDQAR